MVSGAGALGPASPWEGAADGVPVGRAPRYREHTGSENVRVALHALWASAPRAPCSSCVWRLPRLLSQLTPATGLPHSSPGRWPLRAPCRPRSPPHTSLAACAHGALRAHGWPAEHSGPCRAAAWHVATEGG